VPKTSLKIKPENFKTRNVSSETDRSLKPVRVRKFDNLSDRSVTCLEVGIAETLSIFLPPVRYIDERGKDGDAQKEIRGVTMPHKGARLL